MPSPEEEDKLKLADEIMHIIEKWSFEFCAFCDPGTLVSIDGMVNFRCIKCGRAMNDGIYLGEIAQKIFDYSEKHEHHEEDG